MYTTHKHKKTRNIISPDAVDAAFLSQFFDNLFDSLNAGSFDRILKKNSLHHELWDQSLKILSTMRFIDKSRKTMSVLTIRNWISTIKSLQTLYKVLQSVNIRSFLSRHINQDSLENFFGEIRLVLSTNPKCNAFIMAYKTLAKHLQTETSSCINTAADFSETTNQLSLIAAFVQGQIKTFIAGYILKKLNKDLFKNCKYCLNLVCSTIVSNDHQLISAREYKSICHHENIFYNLCNNVHNIFNFDDILNCPEHHKIFPVKIVEIVVKLMINHCFTEVNRILLGKKKVRQNENDPIKEIDNAWHLKHSKRKVQGKFMVCVHFKSFIIRPPFLRNQKQFSKEDALLSKNVAKARVHIERINQRLKSFKIFQQTFP
ncbi:THAP-type domain-containing protein [Aphis craccivora]|uniref:THAP-type domain-containing protein n=1 Tax=Aphis craccivora TaxID=307492 RepID=A0A6G0WR08_APHCR|nr:THAP-type domain-containing protein [Aphis craccivora]